jgi:hypothetical protein
VPPLFFVQLTQAPSLESNPCVTEGQGRCDPTSQNHFKLYFDIQRATLADFHTKFGNSTAPPSNNIAILVVLSLKRPRTRSSRCHIHSQNTRGTGGGVSRL